MVTHFHHDWDRRLSESASYAIQYLVDEVAGQVLCPSKLPPASLSYIMMNIWLKMTADSNELFIT